MRDTIDMAREVKATAYTNRHYPDRTTYTFGPEQLKAFEALVRADEREACAKVCESEAEMFKSCAYGANDGRYDWKEDGARDSAAAIRARGNT
jgi:hypothetical protein